MLLVDYPQSTVNKLKNTSPKTAEGGAVYSYLTAADTVPVAAAHTYLPPLWCCTYSICIEYNSTKIASTTTGDRATMHSTTSSKEVSLETASQELYNAAPISVCDMYHET